MGSGEWGLGTGDWVIIFLPHPPHPPHPPVGERSRTTSPSSPDLSR
ncbi:MAG: hypothetical protein KME21_04755 [Desmonostoc vinosum HA7617-LM4]|nr:hypothetical protein [Desmonostoc vinosum HA7617-LM4]